MNEKIVNTFRVRHPTHTFEIVDDMDDPRKHMLVVDETRTLSFSVDKEAWEEVRKSHGLDPDEELCRMLIDEFETHFLGRKKDEDAPEPTVN